MPWPRPRNHATTSFSSSFIAFLLLSSVLAAAQQQRPQDDFGSPRERVVVDTITPNQHSRIGRNNPQQKRNNPIAAQNERAIATLPSAPAPSDAVRAPPSAPGTSGGLLPRPGSARSLQDWEVEDFVLLATVDGQIHARDRETGQERWSLYVGRPMVETTYDTNKNTDPDLDSPDMPFIWIVEPSQNGNIYVYTPQANAMQKLDVTVQMLADMSPWSTESPPMVYTAEKKTTLYTIDARTGNVLRRFSSGGSTTFNNTNCERTTGFESSNKECTGALTLGQIEYTVSIQNRETGESICTIKYFEWSHNKKDNDLYDQYLSTMDNKYVYSKYDGTVFALDHTKNRRIHPQRPVYTRKFDSPVVRVFDVARPFHDDSPDPPLVLLPQPHSMVENEVKDIWVNCTEAGSWYAMSEFNYPAVTDGANEAKCYDINLKSENQAWDSIFGLPSRSSLVGVHSLVNGLERLPQPEVPRIDGPDGDKSDGQIVVKSPADPEQARHTLTDQWYWIICFLAIIVPIIVYTAPRTPGLKKPLKPVREWVEGALKRTSAGHLSSGPTEPAQPELPPTAEDSKDRPRVHFVDEKSAATTDGLQKVDSPLDAGGVMTPQIPSLKSEDSLGVSDDATETVEDAEAGAEATPKKKKAHRGQRGGKKRRKNTKSGSEDQEQDELSKIVALAKNVQPQLGGPQPDEIAVNGVGVTDPSGVIKLGRLTINTDRVLGNGSGGTFVFEGKWKERVVAIKRMLPQYFGLAEQEVSLLQESDHHRNVIRYFDDEKDQNFLYIAVELCQASLWDLYRDGRGDEPLTEEQNSLVTQINSNVPKALLQLAAGLNHLHTLRIIHRDIKPQNILIAYPQRNEKDGPRLVISDFGLCKTLPENVSTLIGTTGNAGTIGWKAPELILQPKENERNSSTMHSRESTSSSDPVALGVKRSVDIFSLGCVFFYVLTNGSHPFDDDEGWMQVRELNIKKNKPNYRRLEYLGSDIEEPLDLLRWMLHPAPEHRPTAMQVMQHPFFWDAEKRLSFLCDCSDHWEREPRDPPSWHLELLQRHLDTIVDDMTHKPTHADKRPDFLARLDRKFIDTLGKQRKYSGDKVLDLLRALRNKRHHYEDMPPDVQARVGPLPAGYLGYWTQRFPNLLIECYKCVMECGLQAEPRFLPYFKDLA